MAWVLIAGGAGVATVGLLLLTRFGLATFRGDLMKDLAGWGSIELRDIEPATLRRSLKDLWKEDPRLAAEADEGLRSFDDLRQKDPGALGRIELFYRFMYVARYVAIAMVALGVAAVAGGTAPRSPRLTLSARSSPSLSSMAVTSSSVIANSTARPATAEG